jgi:ubiquinone/menaquinone biosynthesis C-methylase UbiE
MEQRFAFDQIANVYKVARPDYPEALIEDVVSYADLKQGDPILEVGCGTGQATKSFAKRGFPIVAMDPGPEMLRGAREDLAGFSNVELLETTFEAWPANRGAFRLIIAAQSWHWVSPEVRLRKPQRRFRLTVRSRCLDTSRSDCPPSYSLSSRTFTCVEPASGVPHRKLGTYLLVRSKDCFTNQGYSGRSSTENIRGSGNARH